MGSDDCYSLQPQYSALQENAAAFAGTYKALTLFHEGNYAPKGITNILLYMDHFLSRVAQAPGPKEGCIFGILFDHYMIFSDMIAALKEGFLSGRYETAYPVLSVRDCHKNTYLFDVENDNLKELMGEGA